MIKPDKYTDLYRLRTAIFLFIYSVVALAYSWPIVKLFQVRAVTQTEFVVIILLVVPRFLGYLYFSYCGLISIERLKRRQRVFLLSMGLFAAYLLLSGALTVYHYLIHPDHLVVAKAFTPKIPKFIADIFNVAQDYTASKLAKQWRAEADGVWLARDLVNTPANKMFPEEMAKAARKMCRQAGLKCKVLGKPEIEKLKMGAFLGVNAGSAKPPRFIIMEHSPKGATAKTKTVCVVGKGLTFDSGGISLKPWDGMWEMKGDMGGAAATIGIMRSIAALKPKVRVIGLCPCTENMPDGNALKPGDVIHSMSGKSIEIYSTDAEGRLVLADALEYATKYYKPDVIIDLATLTGACVVALGHDIIGLFTDDCPLTDDLMKAGCAANEAIWPLPMFEDYKELLKSNVADQKNVGGRWGGAITAALFLRRFTDVKKYAHLDIAGPGIVTSEKWHSPRGGTGAGVRLVVEYIMGLK